MKKILPLIMILVLPLIVSGCFLSSKTPILKESTKIIVPDISGAYKNNKNESATVKKQQNFTNAFIATSPDGKSNVFIIFEPLSIPNHYLLQLSDDSKDGQEYVLMTAVFNDGRINIYGIDEKIEDVTKRAKKYKIELDYDVIVKYPDLDKLKKFYESLFADKKLKEVSFFSVNPNKK